MDTIQYLGEHLWVHQIGHFCIVLSFVAALIAAISYSFSVKKDRIGHRTWLQMGRIAYLTHGISLLAMASMVLYAMYHHYYEYAYVFEHVSDDLPLRYVLSAFWEGQEGSFILWMFWHIVLGWIIMTKKGEWEAPVLAVLAMVEFFLASMLLGVHISIGDWSYKLGINPTVLLRNTIEAPIFSNPDYLSLIKGNGLNPLLQNYWMTIHPPITFLGFASTVVPFAFAVAGLWRRKYTEWLNPALGWALFSAGILGSGILMGSLWAYEALSFGGYWSWDPVENAVLVPWLLLVGGVHTHLVARNTGYSIRPTIAMYILSFVLIVYSTYLTRSGILGDTSAHAFTEMGLENQLIAFQLFSLALGFGWMFYRMKEIPKKKQEESIYAREFWMYIGSLVLLFSGVLILWSTSLPVFNSIISSFDESYVGRVINDPIDHYNKYQLWIAVFVAVLSGSTVFLRYRESKGKARGRSILIRIAFQFIVAAVLTLVFNQFYSLPHWQYFVLVLFNMYAVVSSLDYLITKSRFDLKNSASAIAHFGFGLMILGIVASGLSKFKISKNPFVFKGLFSAEDAEQYVQLIKDKPFFAQGYWLTYESDTLVGNNRFFTIDFKKTEGKDQKVVEEFKLRPYVGYSNDMTEVKAYNPDTRHKFTEDLFSCVVALAPTKTSVKNAHNFEDTLSYTRHYIKLGDTLRLSKNAIVLDNISFAPTHKDYVPDENDFGFSLVGKAFAQHRPDKVFDMESSLGLRNNLLYKYQYDEPDLGLRVQIKDSIIAALLTPEDQLTYATYTVSKRETITVGEWNISIDNFINAPEQTSYKAEEGDIAVAAALSLTNGDKIYKAEPLYLIRNNRPMGIKSYTPEAGLHIKFKDIDPVKERFTFEIAMDNLKEISDVNIPIEVAENVPRSDYIILRADIFPGINMFWIGSILIMFAFFLAAVMRVRMKVRSKS